MHDLLIGTPGMVLAPRIADAEPGAVPGRAAPSIFSGAPPAAIPTRERDDTVIVTGCISSGCVRASVIDASTLGFRAQVPEACVGDRDAAAHAQNVTDIGRRDADIIGCDAAIAATEAWARRNDRA